MKPHLSFPSKSLCVCVSDSSVSFPQAEIDAAVQLLLKLKVEYKQVTGQDYKAGCLPSESSVAPSNGPAADQDTVDPWNVSTTSAKGVDYDKLIGEIQFSFVYGCHLKSLYNMSALISL